MIQFYLIGRSDCQQGATAAEIDRGYAEALASAHDRGVEVLAYTTRFTPSNRPRRIEVGERCPFEIPTFSFEAPVEKN